MTISSFELYMILKLDDIVNMFNILGLFLLISNIVSIIVLAVWLLTDGIEQDKRGIQHVSIIKKTLFISWGAFFVVIFLQTIIPTTRQMASILVVPAIVNSNFVQKELPSDLKEIYTLAKEGMTKALSDKKDDKNE